MRWWSSYDHPLETRGADVGDVPNLPFAPSPSPSPSQHLMHLAAPFPAVIEACFPIIADEENDGRPRVSAINAYDRRKRTPLHRAAAAGAIESIHLLIKVGAIVDAPDLEGLTPLFLCALMHDRDEAMRALMGHRASATARDVDGLTMLHRCAKQGKLSAVEILLNEGAFRFINIIYILYNTRTHLQKPHRFIDV